MRRLGVGLLALASCVQVVPLGSDTPALVADVAPTGDADATTPDAPPFDGPRFDVPRDLPDAPDVADASADVPGDAPPDVPALTMRSGAVTAFALGDRHTCALVADGTVWCWGGNDHGQLGDGTTATRDRPVHVRGLPAATAIAAGAEHTCAIAGAGRLWCWGRGADGRLMVAGDTDRSSPVDTSLTVARVAAGGAHTCVLQEGRARCAGADDAGQLGAAGGAAVAVPVMLTALAAGGAFTCGLGGDGSVWCWGRNADGELGLGTRSSSGGPAQVAGLSGAEELAAGARHACVRRGTEVWCWGDRATGQHGDGPGAPRTTAQRIAAWDGARGLTAGAGFTCAFLHAQPSCAGANDRGQLGQATGFMSDSDQPLAVAGFTRAPPTVLVAGARHACAYTPTDDHAWCWGDGADGQLGSGARAMSRAAVALVW